jgi:hypothetical protein
VQFIRTTKATDWKKPHPTISERITKLFLSIIPSANPGYDSNLYLVREWLIEIDDDGRPNREIGINRKGEPVIAGPSEENYGFWLDTNMSIADFCGEPLSEYEFEEIWKKAVDKLLL